LSIGGPSGLLPPALPVLMGGFFGVCSPPERELGMKEQNRQQIVGHVTTEKTSKVLKAQQLVAGIMVAGGLYAAFSVNGQAAANASVGVIVVGLAWMAVVSLIAWWNHG